MQNPLPVCHASIHGGPRNLIRQERTNNTWREEEKLENLLRASLMVIPCGGTGEDWHGLASFAS